MAATSLDVSPSTSGNARTARLRLFFASVLIILLTGSTFSDVGSFDFLSWDDELLVLPHLRREGGLTARSVIWSFQPQQGWLTPLPYLSLFLDANCYGLKPAGFHITSLAIHVINSVLVLLVFHRLTQAVWPSALAAAIFAVHPLHVEPVAWITGRWELLLGTFWLLGMWSYVRYCEARTWRACLLVALAYSAAILAKPMALTFPFALLLLDVWPLRRVAVLCDSTDQEVCRRLPRVTWQQALLEKLPLFAMMLTAFGVAWRAKYDFLADAKIVKFSASEKLFNSFETYAIYCEQFFWPANLSFYYPHPALGDGFNGWHVSLCFAALVAVTVIATWQFARRPYMLIGWLWYLGVFVPAIGWAQVEQHARADRYTYLPLIGLSAIVCWGAQEAARSLPQGRLLVGAVAVCFVLALGYLSHQQAATWKDSNALMAHALRVNSDNYKALNILGHLATREGDYPKAERYFRAALAAHESGQRHFTLAKSLYQQDRIDEAYESLNTCVRLDPTYVPAYHLLAKCLLRLDRPAEASEQFEVMLRLNPDSTLANVWYAEHLARQGYHDQAAVYYRQALKLEPDAEIVVVLLGEELEQAGQYDLAIQHYEVQYAARPRRVDLANRLAWLLATHPNEDARNGTRAVELASRLAELSSFQNRFVLDTLAAAYAETAAFPEAIETVDRAIAIASEEKDAAHLVELRKRRELYASKQPYRDTRRFDPSFKTARR